MRPENLLLVVMLGGLLFLMYSRTRKQQREAQQIQAGLTVGAEVMTTAGLFATVVALDDQTVVLETAPGQRSKWDRRAVARIVDSAGSLGEPDDTVEVAADDEGTHLSLDKHHGDEAGSESIDPSTDPGTAPPGRG